MQTHMIEHSYQSKEHRQQIIWVARKNFVDEDDLINSVFVELLQVGIESPSVADVRKIADKLAKRIKRARKHDGYGEAYYHEYGYIDNADDFERYRQDIDGTYDSPLWEDMH